MEASLVYQDKLIELEEAGLPSIDEALVLAEKKGLFLDQDRDELDDLQDDPMFKYQPIGDFKDEADKNRFLEKCMLEIILGYRIIRADEISYSRASTPNGMAYSRYAELNAKKIGVIKHSREHYAEQARAEKLAYYSSFNGDTKKPIWSSWEEFLEEKKLVQARTVELRCMEFLGGFNSSTLRALARHPMWRSKWISATKTGASIFKGHITEWNTNQALLAYWSNFYDSIYTAHEPPENFIIEKDNLLDSWLASKSSENKNGNKVDENEDGVRAFFANTKVNKVKRK